MKRPVRIIAIIIFVAGLIYLFASTSFPFFPDKTRCMAPDSCLIETHWKQIGGFEKCTPDRLRLGCWSTALAQIVYYHKLKPFGYVEYTSRQGYHVREKIDTPTFRFELFTPVIDTAKTESSAQMARYNYYAALAVQKDFGTDRYMHKLAPASLLEEHYHLKAERFISWHGFGPYTLGKLEKVMYEELNAKRPILLHFANLKDFGHSVVVDDYCYKDDTFFIHTNQGQGGPTDGWYDFYKGILRPDDTKLRVIYTLQPTK